MLPQHFVTYVTQRIRLQRKSGHRIVIARLDRLHVDLHLRQCSVGMKGGGALDDLMRERIRATTETIIAEELEAAPGVPGESLDTKKAAAFPSQAEF